MRGWNAYVKYDGQPQTCRVCEKTDHLAKDCPYNLKRKPQENQPKDAEMPHEPEPNPTPEEVSSTPTMQEAEPHVFSNTSLQKEEDCMTTSTVKNVPQKKSEVTIHVKSWAEHSAPENQSIGETKVKLGLKTYCPRCRVDSDSEAECVNALVKHVNKRKLPVRGVV